MARQIKQTTVEEREIVINNFKNGETIRKISEIVNKSKSTVFDIIKRYRETGRIENKDKNSQNRRKISVRNGRYLLREVKNDPLLSAVELQKRLKDIKGVDVNAETVRRFLRKNNFNARVARRKPLISEKNRQLRYRFAEEYRSKDMTFWSTVLFTDEVKINLFGSDGRRLVWRKSGEAYNDKAIKKTVKHGGGSLMLWGCMSAGGVGNLHRISGIMDAKSYLNILKENVKESAEHLGIKENFVFYQDNDPKHTAWDVKNWLLYNCPKVLATPPQSPDINVIEHLWAELKKRVAKKNVSNMKALQDAVTEEWQRIEPSFCKRLVESMPRRLEAVLKNNGNSTKY